jgi:membrane protein YqaA with SNARE-associated domain
MPNLAILLSTMVGCFVGSLVPVVNTELVVLAAAAAAPPELALALVLVASSTQMVAKSLLYLGGSGLVRLPNGWMGRHVAKALAGAQTRQAASSALLFASASTGFPPFYVMSVASGALRIDFGRFFVLGLLGRTLRFAVLVAFPVVLESLFR